MDRMLGRMMMKRVIGIVLASFLVAGLVGCGRRAAPQEVEPVEEVDTPAPTISSPLSTGQAVLADGELASPYPALPLGFDGGVSGQVLTITVQAGDVVQAGDLLAVLDDEDLQQAVADAQLALDRATVDRERALLQWEQDVADAEQSLVDAERALTTARLRYSSTSIEEARAALERARQAEADAEQAYWQAERGWPPIHSEPYYEAWQRAIQERELAEMRLADAEDTNSASYLEIEARQADVDRAERRLAVLEEGLAPTYDRAVEDAEQRLAEAQEALANAHLTAPWDAIVLSVDVAPAATVGPGVPVVTLLNVEEGLRFVTQNLNEQHVANIRAGQRAVVTLRTFADTPLEGTVEAVVPRVGAAAAADARFAVYVRLGPTELELLPGLTGRVEIFTE